MVNSKQNIMYGIIAIIGVGSIYIIKKMFTNTNTNTKDKQSEYFGSDPNKVLNKYLGNPQTDPYHDTILIGGKRKSVKKYRKRNNKTKR